MRIAEIDVQDDDQISEWWRVADTAQVFGREEFSAYWSLKAAFASFRAENNPMRQQPLACWEDDRMVGVAHLSFPMLDNTHLAITEAYALPQHRRRGVGGALLSYALDRARAEGRTTVLSEISMPFEEPPSSAGSKFAEKHGFSVASLEIHRVLELPVDNLDDLQEGIGGKADEYQLVTFGDRVPDELLDGFCALQIAFNSEAPMGEMDLEPEVWDEARVRNSEERFERQGRHQRRTVAIAPDGTMAALTEMMATDEQTELGWQGGTLVLKEHRGHRLGLATKIANLRAFGVDFPTVRKVHSWNAEENAQMVAINDALGFQPVEYGAEMQLRL
jgi:GNAT superfamily N-acetyltransferase